MGFASWVQENWFSLFQSAGIAGGLVFTAMSFRDQTKSNRVQNLITIYKESSKLWRDFAENPSLASVFSHRTSDNYEWTVGEEVFLNRLILHLNTTWWAMQEGEMIKIQSIEDEVRWFFAHPLPKAFWESTKKLRDKSFVGFIDNCLAQKS